MSDEIPPWAGRPILQELTKGARDELFRQMENVEADAWAEIQSSVSPSFQQRFDISVAHLESTVVLTAPKSDMLALNRVWLPGHRPTANGSNMEEVLRYAKQRGVARLALHWPDWARAEAGKKARLVPGTPMMKMLRKAEPLVNADSRVRIEGVGTDRRQLFGAIAARGNDAPDHMADGFNSTIGLPGWMHYLAFDDEKPVGAAALRLFSSVAWCCFAGVLPEYRGRGGQRALLARRVHDAASAGCRWVTCEALPHRQNRPNPSLSNMLAVGFCVAYERPTFIVDVQTADV